VGCWKTYLAFTLEEKREGNKGVGDWFQTFCGNLRISTEKRSSLGHRNGRIVGQLNADLRHLDSKTSYRFYVGSYGRSTAIPSVSDVDLLYELPNERATGGG
jgi:hypothetical protein